VAASTTAAPVIVVVGPTAAGKSALAMAIAGWCDGEVVSADAFQVYRGLDIGTAKEGADATAAVPHHCIDLVDPDEHYTAGRYAADAAAAVADIHARGRVAVVAGGSGFYIRALVEGLAPLPPYDGRWRMALEAVEARRGMPFLFGMLEALDPVWAAAVGATDRQRLYRGIEVTLRAGTPMSTLLQQRDRGAPQYQAEWIALTFPRPLLYARIEARVDAMLAAGWLEEVQGLRAAGYSNESPGMRAIGYRELCAHLAGEFSLEEARQQVIRATRRYAKRQLTWFRGQCPATWYEQADDGAPAQRHVYEQVEAHLRQKPTC